MTGHSRLAFIVCVVALVLSACSAQAIVGLEPAAFLGGGFPSVAAVEGSYAYCGTGGWGGGTLLVVDLSDPATPEQVGSCELLAGAIALAVAGDYAYVSVADPGDEAWRNGVQVVDVSDPAAPEVVGWLHETLRIEYLAAVGDHVYGTNRDRGLMVIDVSDPASPSLAGAFAVPEFEQGNVGALALSYPYAYVGWGVVDPEVSFGVRVIDVSDPAHPVQAGEFSSTEAGTCPFDLAAVGDHLFMLGDTTPGYGVRVLDISNRTAPVVIGECSVDPFPERMTVYNDFAYLASWSGLEIVDLTDLENPVQVGSQPQPELGGLAAGEDYLILPSAMLGVQIADLADPASPAVVGTLPVPAYASAVALSQDRAFVAGGWGPVALHAVDVSDPGSPAVTGLCLLPDYWEVRDMAVAGGYAYLAADAYLSVVDVSDPQSPAEAGNCQPASGCWGVAVSGSYAYCGGYDGFAIIDIGNPAAPEEVGYWEGYPGEYCAAVALRGDYAFLAIEAAGLRVIDISDPTLPAEVAAAGTYGSDIAIAGDLAYLCGNGLQILDISTPTSPTEMGAYDAPEAAETAVAVFGSLAFVTFHPYADAEDEVTLRVLDVSDPAAPVMLAATSLPNNVWDLVVDDTYVYLADDGWGFWVFQWLLPTFPDVGLDFWAFGEVDACCQAGIVSGYPDGLYRPSAAVDRAQIAVFIARALAGGDEQVPEPTADPGFTDVDSEHWAYRYVCYGVNHNVVQGYPEGDYKPEQELTRDQMAAFVARAMAGGDSGVPAPVGEPTFPDVPADHWAYRYVEYCSDHGVVSGYPEGDYRPDAVVTRDQIAVYIARAFDLVS